jgi:hypothetical protein
MDFMDSLDRTGFNRREEIRGIHKIRAIRDAKVLIPME